MQQFITFKMPKAFGLLRMSPERNNATSIYSTTSEKRPSCSSYLLSLYCSTLACFSWITTQRKQPPLL